MPHHNTYGGGPSRRTFDTDIFHRVNAILLADMYDFCGRWAPGGYLKGGEYIARSSTCDDENRGSFRLNLKTGRWADFAKGKRGGDPVSYFAHVFDLSQIAAARALAADLGVD